MSASRPPRVVLDGVPRVHFYEGGKRCPEDFGLASSIRAYAEYLGDPYVGCNSIRSMAQEPDPMLGCSYGYGILASGMGFQQVWHHSEWRYPGDLMRMAPDPTAVYRRAFEPSGYPCEVIGNAAALEAMGISGETFDACLDEAALRERIVASIHGHRRPVLALGVVGPPECGLVAGYDEGGDVLVGWSYFQNVPEFAGNGDDVSFEPSGYYRKRHWYADTPAVFIIGDRDARPPTKEMLRRALAWNVELARTPTIGDYHSGLAALDAWAAALRDGAHWDADWPTLRERYQTHHAMVGTIAEARWYTGVVLAHAGTLEEHMGEHLLRAAACCSALHRLMWDIWNAAGGIGEDDDKVRRGTTPEVRARIADLIDRTRAVDGEAIEHLERALAV